MKSWQFFCGCNNIFKICIGFLDLILILQNGDLKEFWDYDLRTCLYMVNNYSRDFHRGF